MNPDSPARSATVSLISSVVVILPAHDEQALISTTLASLERAAAHQCLPVTGVLVLDSCRDATESIVRVHVESRSRVIDWVVASSSARRASTSRQHGLDCYLEGSTHASGRDGVAVLSTDADTVVPENWISVHVELLESGADAVAGIVEVDPGTSDDFEYDAWWREYSARFREDGSHPHVHCANLSIRLASLVAAGGFGHESRAEDIDLWKRLKLSTDARLRSDRSSIVLTSRRRDGRVVGGFATALDQFRRPLAI